MANQKKPRIYGKREITRRDFLKAGGAVIASAVLFDSLAACTPNTTTEKNLTTTVSAPIAQATTPKYGGTLKAISFPAEANVGWPAEMNASTSVIPIQTCLETLLRGDNKGNIIPWLAESYKVAGDLSSITFTLRKGVKFYDGSDFNAEVAKWNLDNYINAMTQPNWASVDIIDDYTIRVNFTQWVNVLPSSFGDCSSPAFMISKAAFDKNGKAWMRQNPVGTGPFKFTSFQLDVSLKAVKNPDYWVKGKPYLDGIEYIFVVDTMAQKMAMEAGVADKSIVVSNKLAADYTAMGLTVKTIISVNRTLTPDTANPDSPWANKKLREAVEYAIDRETIAKTFGYGYCQALYQIPPRYTLAYNPDFTLGRKYDADKAKQLLAEAGSPDGFKTTIIAAPGAERDVILAVQDYLAKVGIQAELDFPEIGTFATYMGPGTWPKNSMLYMNVIAGDINFLGGLQFMFNVFGQSWLRTPELTQSYQAALGSPTLDIKLIRAVSDMITEDALLIPILETGSGETMQPYVMDAGVLERGDPTLWNTEDVWLNK